MTHRIDLSNGWLSPVHHSDRHGVHADINPYDGSPKIHVPYVGQTTLGMFGIGHKPEFENLSCLGPWSLRNIDIIKR